MIRRALIVDTETTGLDPAKDKAIEVAAVLYSVENQTTLMQFSALIPHDSNPCEKINRIPVAALAEVQLLTEAPDVPRLNSVFATMRGFADVIVAHNAEFDQQFFKGDWRKMEWLCTMSDFAWPAATRDGGSLVHLALDHGIGVASAHRALTDCQLIAALFDRMARYGQDLQEMFTRAMRPKALFQAIVPFEQKDLAKDAGFKWDGDARRWTRRMAIEDAAALPFKTLKLREGGGE